MNNIIGILRGLGLVAVLLICAAAISVLYVYLSTDSHVDQRMAECRLLWRSGDLAGARRGLLELYTEDETNAEVIELLGEIELGRGELRQAITWLDRVPESEPQRASVARYRAAQLAMQLGHVRDTESLANEALRLDPHFAEPRRLLMRCYFILLQHPQLVEQSVALDKQGQLLLTDLLMRCIAHRASWDDDHVAWLEQCLRTDPANAIVRAALARNYSARDRNEEAWRLLNAAASGSPDDWRILLARAEQEIHEGRFEIASRTLAGLPGQADSESRVWLARSRVWVETGQEVAARVGLEIVTKLDPYDPTPSYVMSRIVAAQGEEGESRAYFQQSQQRKDLMGLLSRLMEASNPAYHPVEPIAVTMKQAQQAFLIQGFHREAEILANVERAGAQQVPTKPLTMAAVSDIAEQANLLRRTGVFADSNVHQAAADPKHAGGISFQDIATEIGLSFQYETGNSPYRWLMETLGGGVAVLDYDLDGWDDIYLTQGGPLPIQASGEAYQDRFFRNLQGETAGDVTAPAMLMDHAYGQGCAVGDYDNDGFPDLVVCNYGELLVFHNQGDGTFSNAGRTTSVASSKWSTSAVFSDLDRDGDLDLYVVQYLDAPFEHLKPCMHQGAYTSCRPFVYDAESDMLWENLGDGRFVDRTEEFGLIAPEGKGLGVAIADFDRSGHEAIFVANDTTANFLFTRSPESTGMRFRETGGIDGIAVNRAGLTEACMGIGLGDVNGDGRFDLFVTNFQGETNTLYVGSDYGGFTDETERAGLATSSRNRMGWGCQFLDVDCSGDLDLFVANGQLHGPPQLAQLYYNQGGGRFAEISEAAGPYFRQPWMGRSAALIDWNRDMLTDVAVTYTNENTSLLQNTSRAENRLLLKLTGVESNRDAIGALVEAKIGDRTAHFCVTRGGGYFAANDPKILIGCGTATRIDSLRVNWPSGRVTTFQDVPAGKAYLVIEDRDVLVIQGD